MKSLLFAGLACTCVAAPYLYASPITIGDPSFEGNSLAVGDYSTAIGPEWTGSGGQNSNNAFEERINGFASEGTDHLGMEWNYDVWQNLGVTYQANTRYTLTVGVGNRSAAQTQAGNNSQFILADSAGVIYATGSFNASTIPASSFADATVVFDTPNIPSAVGKTIRVLLRARGAGRSHFDNLRLDASPIVATPPTVINLAAISVSGNSATLRGRITEAGSNVPNVRIYYGTSDGGTNPDSWASSITLGTQSGNFTSPASGLSPSTTYYYRAFASNSSGTAWAPSSSTFTTTNGVVAPSAVINEFHHKPEDEHEMEEFIELYNPGDSALDMGNWTLSSAVTYTFPPGTSLPAHGYLVVAMNPASIQTRYGITALGPWSGKLSSGGENIVLKNSLGVTQDSVNYIPGFPWPSANDGETPSAELINPGLNNDLGGSWRVSNGIPTPGALNSTYQPIELTPPHIQDVAHSPQQPTSNQAVTVTAKISDPDGMGPVALKYQLVNPGAYIRLTDTAYQTTWTSVPMYDDGTNGDATAGDSIYTAVLPANLQTHRRLVRYRITFADVAGNSQTVPYADDTQANFAYFVSDGIPAWSGSLRPGTTPVQTFSSQTLTKIPVYTLIANGTDVINAQYVSGYDADRFRGTFVYEGKVYDHIEFRNRGQGSTYQSGKNKWRFYFNPSRDFSAKDHFGTPYTETWGSFSANACASPWAPVHRGSAGVEEALSLKIFQLAGVPSPYAHYYHFRVIRSANETPAAGASVSDPIATSGTTDGQYAGDFWGLYLAIERLKGSFLDERGMEDGNIYKIEGGAGEPENILPGHPYDSSDWNSYRSTVENTTPTEAWWRANLDLEKYYTFHALNRLVGNIDLRAGENHFFYHRPSDNRWVVIPWDLDMMFIPKTHQGTTINNTFHPGVISTHKAILQNPALALEFRNRAREILDLMASDASNNGGQIGQLLDEFGQIVAPDGTTDNWANADAAMWNMHPRTKGADGSPSGQNNHKGNFFYTPFQDSRNGGPWTRWLRTTTYNGVASHADLMTYFRDYATNAWTTGTWTVNNGNQLGYGYQFLLSEAADSAIPTKPTITYTGNAGYPSNNISFSASAFADPQGAGTYTSTQWRVAEISAPGIPGYVANTPRKYEIENGWSVTNTGTTVTLPTSVIKNGKTYRARVRHQDNTGRWSNWSNPIQFTGGAAVETMVHYWNFNNSSALLTPNQGNGSITANGSSVPYSGNGQNFVGANALNGDGAGNHLRCDNPIGTTLTFSLPTTGYENIVGRVETRRSGQGAGTQTWTYTIDGTNYLPWSTVTVVDGNPPVVEFDFRAIAEARNNPNFALRVAFSQGAGFTTGNNRFDNFTLSGNPIPGTYAAWKKNKFNASQHADYAFSNPNADPDNDGRSNFLEFALATSPTSSDMPEVRFTWSQNGANRHPAVSFKRPTGATGVAYELLAGDLMSDWPIVSSAAVSANPNGDGTEQVIFRDIQTDANSQRFLRLRVKEVP